MSFRTTPRFTRGTVTQNKESPENAGIAKVTLVKPVQAQKAAVMNAPPRPKIGRSPVAGHLPVMNRDWVYGIAEEYTDSDQYDAANGYAAKEGTHLWDSRFALLLVLLLILVNAGLVVLLQHGHRNTQEISIFGEEKIDTHALTIHENRVPLQSTFSNPPVHAPAAPAQAAGPAHNGALLDLPGNNAAAKPAAPATARPARGQGNAQDLLAIINKE